MSAVSNTDLSTGAPAPVENKCVFSGACDWFKTKKCAGPALACLAAAFIAAYSLPFLVTAVAIGTGVASNYVLKQSYSYFNDIGEVQPHRDFARHAAGVAVAFFAPSLALYSLSFTLFQFGNLVGRQFIKA